MNSGSCREDVIGAICRFVMKQMFPLGHLIVRDHNIFLQMLQE